MKRIAAALLELQLYTRHEREASCKRHKNKKGEENHTELMQNTLALHCTEKYNDSPRELVEKRKVYVCMLCEFYISSSKI